MTMRHDTKIREEDVDTREGKKKRGVSHAEDEEEYRMAWDDLTDPGGRGSRSLDSLGRPATTEK